MASRGNGEPGVNPADDGVEDLDTTDVSLGGTEDRTVDEEERIRQEREEWRERDRVSELQRLESHDDTGSREAIGLPRCLDETGDTGAEATVRETATTVTGSDLRTLGDSNPVVSTTVSVTSMQARRPAEAATGNAFQRWCLQREDNERQRLRSLEEDRMLQGQYDFGSFDAPFRDPMMPTLHPIGHTPRTGSQLPDQNGGRERQSRAREPPNDDDDDNESLNSAYTFISHQSHASRKDRKKLRDNSNIVEKMMVQMQRDRESAAELARLEHASRAEEARLQHESRAEEARLQHESRAEEARLQHERRAEEARMRTAELETKAEQARLDHAHRESILEQARQDAQHKAEQARWEYEYHEVAAKQAMHERENAAEQMQRNTEQMQKEVEQARREQERARQEVEKLQEGTRN
jgi:hypothetical protein